MIVHTYPDVIQTARELALSLADDIKKSIQARKAYTLALCGGNSPVYYLSQLAMQSIDWNWVHIFWAHERVVSPDSHHSNFKLAQQYLFDRIMIPHQNIHRIKGELRQMALNDYIQDIQTFFKKRIIFDCVVLGLNIKGYLSPFYAQSPVSDPDSGEVAMVSPHPYKSETQRIGLTLPIVNQARRIVLFVTGQDKSQVLKQFYNAQSGIKRSKSFYPVLNPEALEIYTDIDLKINPAGNRKTGPSGR
ncbi:MAG: 6-phosphogluconolactonase [Candidatus Delongbacteria bacterium]|nr:6-phosphogluconolactonase [Candidatus Delongbacteria bacterium]